MKLQNLQEQDFQELRGVKAESGTLCPSVLTWHALLGDLTVIDLLLQGVIRNQSVDVARLLLPVAVHPAHGLRVVARVPGSIKHHHSVCSNEVDTQTPSTGKLRQISNCCPGQFPKLIGRDNHHSQEYIKSLWKVSSSQTLNPSLVFKTVKLLQRPKAEILHA